VGGVRTMLGVPLQRDGVAIGVIGLARRRIEAYTDRQIALINTFAERGGIAIGSVAAFQALQERTAELTRSVVELQALEELLRAVNSSLDLDTVLATIISRAAQLSQADEGTIYEFHEAEGVFVPRSAYGMTEERVAALRERKIRLGETHLGRAALRRAPVHVADVQLDAMIAGAGGLLRGIHAVLAVPLLWDEKVVGGLVIRRRTIGGFAPSIPTSCKPSQGRPCSRSRTRSCSKKRVVRAPLPRWRWPTLGALRTGWCSRRRWSRSASSPLASPTKSRTL
jgi:GAF domain-containing protein